jgi:hypothetical protein
MSAAAPQSMNQFNCDSRLYVRGVGQNVYAIVEVLMPLPHCKNLVFRKWSFDEYKVTFL